MLESNGVDSELIRLLLRDAKLWGALSKLLEDQITVLESLQSSYKNKKWTVLHEDEEKDKVEKKIEAFRNETDALSQKMQKLLGNLRATSENIIQLLTYLIHSLELVAYLTIGIQFDIDCGSAEVDIYEYKHKTSQLDNSKPYDRSVVLILSF